MTVGRGSGSDTVTIQAWIGHSELRTTQRYMQYAPRHNDAEVIGAAYAQADPRVARQTAPVAA
jgi:site-specific recombinase XerC